MMFAAWIEISLVHKALHESRDKLEEERGRYVNHIPALYLPPL
jgi:hypothetical protein